MLIPSERLYKQMNAETASVWFVPTVGETDAAMLVKAPSSVLKAVISGCKLTVLLGVDRKDSGSFLCTGLQIFDTPDSPFFVGGVQRHQEEHEALRRILELRGSPIYLFDEMNVCVAWSSASVIEKQAELALSLMGESQPLYTGGFTREASDSIDCFSYSVDERLSHDGAYKIDMRALEPEFHEWTHTKNYFIRYTESAEYSIAHQDEGEALEKSIWFSLDSVFPLTLHKRPQVILGEKERELTDVLCFYPLGTFLIETKALSVLQAGFDRSLERKIKGIKKQMKKGIRQLVGAVKAIQRGDRIMDKTGHELEFDRSVVPHCIVLASEIFHSGDWSDVQDELLDAAAETGALFNALDVQEFTALLKGSSGKPELLDYNLMERFKLFVKSGSIHIRSRPQSGTASNGKIQPTP